MNEKLKELLEEAAEEMKNMTPEEMQRKSIERVDKAFQEAVMPMPLIGMTCVLSPDENEGTLRSTTALGGFNIRERMLGSTSELFDVEITVRYIGKSQDQAMRSSTVKMFLTEMANSVGSKVATVLRLLPDQNPHKK